MIGVFDSGVGGLTVVKQIIKVLPDQPIIYFGDTARLPYGTKGEDFVKKYSEKITQLLLDRGADVIVIACHTSSAWASDYLKKRFNVPIVDVITPAVNEIAKKNSKIGIIGTPGTVKSGSWEKKLLKENPSLKIYSKACPLFVPLVEEGLISGKITENIVKDYLKGFKKIDAIVLACTHYPMLKGVIKKIIGKGVKVIDPAESLAKELKLRVCPGACQKGDHEFFFSDTPYNFKKISKKCLGRELEITVKDPF